MIIVTIVLKKKKKKKNNNNTNDSDTTYTMKDYSDLTVVSEKVWWLAFPSDILYQTRSSVRWHDFIRTMHKTHGVLILL